MSETKIFTVTFVGPDGEPDASTTRAFFLTDEGIRKASKYIIGNKRRDLEASDTKPMDYGIPSSNWDGVIDSEIEEAWERFCIGCSWVVL
jgi:hypothetical protein